MLFPCDEKRWRTGASSVRHRGREREEGTDFSLGHCQDDSTTVTSLLTVSITVENPCFSVGGFSLIYCFQCEVGILLSSILTVNI